MEYSFKKINFEMELKDHKIDRITIHQKNKTTTYNYSVH
jgi:hypothetical protein